MNLFLDLLFPKRCVCCKKLGNFFCINCQSKLIIPIDKCVFCKGRSIGGMTHEKCLRKTNLDGVFCGYVYKFPIKTAIHRYKYPPYISELTPIFGNLLIERIAGNSKLMKFIKTNPLVVPIPMHWFRKHLRGFNQAELLSLYISKALGLSTRVIIKRDKYTKPQSQLSGTERVKNVSNIFSINRKIKVDKVILVDDVLTTGATLESASRVLKKNGVTSIWAVTLAG